MGLAPLIAGSGIAYLIASMMMAYLYREERAEYMAWWAAAFALSAVRQLFAVSVQVLGPEPYMAAPIYFAVIGSGVLLLRGTYSLLEREFPVIWYVLAALIGAWTIVAPFVTDSFLALSLPAFLLRGVSDIFAGITLCRSRNRLGGVFTGTVFIIWGLHRFNYPFLRHVEWFAPWGFELSSVLGLCAAMGILAVHYERTRSDLAMRERDYRDLFENAAIGLIRTDIKGRILEANPSLVRMLGYDSVEDVRKLTMADDVYATPEDRQKLIDNRFNDEVLDGVELNWRRRDGAVRTVRLMTRQYEKDGETLFEGSVRDVTNEKHLQGQLNAARQMEALGRLAGGVAHDFNNMLTAIVGGVQMARLEGRDGMVAVSELDNIETAATQAATLARRLLAFSRNDVEQSNPMRFDEALDNAIALLERLIPKSVNLKVEAGAAASTVNTRPGQLERVIVNLVVNANEAVGGVGTVSVKSWAQDNMVILEVADDGIGMEDSTVARIFEPFFTTDEEEGVGLGLANVREIISELGGTIDVTSELGVGSVFRVEIPRQSGSAQEKVEDPNELVSGDGRLILLAEDTDVVRRQLVRYLERVGFQVLEAADGAEALEIGTKHIDTIDAIVTDVVMPALTGPEVVNRLRQHRPDLPFIYMSGYAESALTNEGVAPEHFIAKPFRPSELASKIRERFAVSESKGS